MALGIGQGINLIDFSGAEIGGGIIYDFDPDSIIYDGFRMLYDGLYLIYN